MLRDQEYGVTLNVLVGELQRLLADPVAGDDIAELLESSDELAFRFDGVVAAWKELRQ